MSVVHLVLVIILREWQEYIDILIDLFFNKVDSTYTMVFSSGDSIMIPCGSDFDSNVEDLIGHRIGIICTDVKEKPFIIRRWDQDF